MFAVEQQKRRPCGSQFEESPHRARGIGKLEVGSDASDLWRGAEGCAEDVIVVSASSQKKLTGFRVLWEAFYFAASLLF